MSKPISIKNEPENEVLEIEGIRYSYELFRHFGHALPLNTPFEIIQRQDQTITIRRMVGQPKTEEEVKAEGGRILDHDPRENPED